MAAEAATEVVVEEVEAEVEVRTEGMEGTEVAEVVARTSAQLARHLMLGERRSPFVVLERYSARYS